MKQNSTILPAHPEPLKLVVPVGNSERIDTFLTESVPGHSRTFFQNLVKIGKVRINNVPVSKVSNRVEENSIITVELPQPVILPAPEKSYSGPIPEILYENEDFLIINKPAGLNVHAPSHASQEHTVVDWLLAYRHAAQHVGIPGRQGIVHRLDKDTSGLMIIALTQRAHAELTNSFKERLVKKQYCALVQGIPPTEGVITFSISRDPHNRIKMTHKIATGRDAVTQFYVKSYFAHHALVQANPVTGRTHQIRVHLSGLGYPIEGDPLYGKRSPFIGRHALHAEKISFVLFGKSYDFFCELPPDFTELLSRIPALKTAHDTPCFF